MSSEITSQEAILPSTAEMTALSKSPELILNPNRSVDPAYQQYVVKTRDGKSESGIIVLETPNSITLRKALMEQKRIFRRDIEEITVWPYSMMPERLQDKMTPQEFADLLAYLTGR